MRLFKIQLGDKTFVASSLRVRELREYIALKQEMRALQTAPDLDKNLAMITRSSELLCAAMRRAQAEITVEKIVEIADLWDLIEALDSLWAGKNEIAVSEPGGAKPS